MTRGAAAITLSGGASAALGVLYWVVAARLFPASIVGRNSSLIAAMTTIAGLTQLNYARSLSGLLPGAGRHARALLIRVYLMTGALALVLGLCYVFAAPTFDTGLGFIARSWWLAAIFVMSSPLWIVFTLEDTALASLRRSDVIPLENVAYGTLKLGALYLLSVIGAGEWAIFISWTVPLLLCVIPVNVLLLGRILPTLVHQPVDERPPTTPRWVVLDAVGYMIGLVGTLPLPVVVLALQGPSAAAVVYMPLTIVTALDALTLSIGNTLTAELVSHPESHPDVETMLRRTLGVLGVLSLSLGAGAPVLLRFFGHEYAGSGTVLLILFMLAAVPRAVTVFGTAVLRARHAGGRILVMNSSTAILTLGVGLPMMTMVGLAGLGIGWLAANLIVAATAFPVLRSALTLPLVKR